MEKTEPKPKYNFRRLIGLFIIALFFMFLGKNLSFIPELNFDSLQSVEKLKSEVKELTKTKTGEYSVYFQDLKTEHKFGINERQIETAASVNKVPIIAALYFLDNKGEISLDDKITIQEKDKQDYGTGSIRYQKLPVTYSLRNLARLSLQQSDNTAAHVLGVKIGIDRIQELVDSWGMSQTNVAENETSAYDMYLLFSKVYKSEITNTAKTKELLSFMTQTDFENRIPGELSKDVKVFHKTGDGEGFVHDAGIIEKGENAYYLGIFTSDIGNTKEATEKTIAEISKKIFNSIK